MKKRDARMRPATRPARVATSRMTSWRRRERPVWVVEARRMHDLSRAARWEHASLRRSVVQGLPRRYHGEARYEGCVRHLPRGASRRDHDGHRVGVHEVPRGPRGVQWRRARGRRNGMRVVPSSARLHPPREGSALSDVSHDGDQARRQEPRPSRLCNVPRRQRPPGESCPGVRDVSCGGAVNGASWASSVRGLPRAALGRAPRHSDLRLLSRARRGGEARAGDRWMRHMPPCTRARRRRHAAHVCLLPRASKAACAAHGRCAFELHHVSLVSRPDARRPRNLHDELSRRSTEPSAGRAGLQRVSPLPAVTLLVEIDHAVDVQAQPSLRDERLIGR
jgi:hypothetical protein